MTITYFMFRRLARAPELGTYRTYDIMAYGHLWRGPVAIVRDVALDAKLVYSMIERFNRRGLSTIHLMDAVLDMMA